MVAARALLSDSLQLSLGVSPQQASQETLRTMSWFRRKPDPPPTSDLRDVLFGDRPLTAWTGDATSEPWVRFADAAACLSRRDTDEAKRVLASITTMPGLESRHYLQAWHALRPLGHSPPPAISKQLLGVIVEVALPTGLDVFAAYDDHTARYLNARGGAAIWEHPNTSLDSAIDQLLSAGREIVTRIGVWTGERRGPPPNGHARITLLTPSGPHFGEGPLKMLERDPLTGPAIAASLALVRGLTQLLAAG